MGNENPTARLAALHYRLGKERGISRLRLADEAGRRFERRRDGPCAGKRRFFD